MATVTLSIPRARRRERAICEYFHMWVTRDFDRLDGIFAPDSVYEEWNGHIYENRNQIHLWIDDTLEHRVVLNWTAAGFTHARGREAQPSITVFWTLNSRDEKEGKGCIDGVSVFEFNRQNKIQRVREFKAEHRRDYPYRNQ